jgi:branched-chain amino acid transport system permease protein
VAAKVLVFVVLVASFDLLLGYTGIVSFAPHHVLRHRRLWRGHRLHAPGPGWGALAVGLGRRCCCRCCCRWPSACSLRVRAIFFAMITLAVAAAFQTLASQLSDSPAARTA